MMFSFGKKVPSIVSFHYRGIIFRPQELVEELLKMSLGDQYSKIPQEMRSIDRWVCWTTRQRDSNQTKVPIDPTTGQLASVKDPTNWTDFATAHTRCDLEEILEGVGFVFVENGPYIGIDLDNCRDPEDGQIDNWAGEIIRSLDSYTEISPSGTGFHVIVRGTVQNGPNRGDDIELYDRSRYFTVTGDVHDCATIRSVQTAVETLQDQYLKPTDSEPVSPGEQSNSSPSSVNIDSGSKNTVSPTARVDAELVQRASRAQNGDLFEDLWSGKESLWEGESGKYESQSEADLALANILAFWTDHDSQWMDHLFRQSGLMRKKWDTVHYADGSTYGERVIEKALVQVTESYSGTFDVQTVEPDCIGSQYC